MADFSDRFGVLITSGALDVEVSGFVIDAPDSTELNGSTGISVETGSGASRIHGNAVRGGFRNGIRVSGKATEVSGNRIVRYRDIGIAVNGQADLVSQNEAFSPGQSPYGTTGFAAGNSQLKPDARAVFSDNTTSGPVRGGGAAAHALRVPAPAGHRLAAVA